MTSFIAATTLALTMLDSSAPAEPELRISRAGTAVGAAREVFAAKPWSRRARARART